LAGLREVVTAAAPTPVLAIGGIDAERVPEILATGARGVAVIGAVARAKDPETAVRGLVTALGAME
jgi:thiamine-phosphate pyrophosphorylase